MLFRFAMVALIGAAAPVAPAPAAAQEAGLGSAMSFLAETVTEESHRIAKPSYRVSVPAACTLRFERAEPGLSRIPVHEVDLANLDPEHCNVRERMICFETASLRNKIRYYELHAGAGLPADPDGGVIAASERGKDRFCFYTSRRTSPRVARALQAALEMCDARSVW